MQRNSLGDYMRTIKWVPSHVGIEGNEFVNNIARNTSRIDELRSEKTFRNDLIPLANKHLLAEWQKRWKVDEMADWPIHLYSCLMSLSILGFAKFPSKIGTSL
jgi:hypothetical protein